MCPLFRLITVHLSLFRRASPYTTKPPLTKILAGPCHTTSTAGTAEENEVVEGSPTVRFASVDEEIDPDKSLESVSIETPGKDAAKLKELSKSLQGTQLQGRRMSHFAFEPVSLPASRVCLHLSSVNEIRNLGYPEWPKSK